MANALTTFGRRTLAWGNDRPVVSVPFACTGARAEFDKAPKAGGHNKTGREKACPFNTPIATRHERQRLCYDQILTGDILYFCVHAGVGGYNQSEGHFLPWPVDRQLLSSTKIELSRSTMAASQIRLPMLGMFISIRFPLERSKRVRRKCV
jgi:hypothetical protein